MNDQRLLEIEARATAATAGLQDADPACHRHGEPNIYAGDNEVGDVYTRQDSALLVHARQDLLDLVAEVRRWQVIDVPILADSEMVKILLRSAEATPGPWDTHAEEGRPGSLGWSRRMEEGEAPVFFPVGPISDNREQAVRDLAFIAAARQDMGRLLADVRRLRVELNEATAKRAAEPPHLCLVTADDWEALYVDGMVKQQHHQVYWPDALRELGFTIEQREVDYSWMVEREDLPERLEDVRFGR